VTAWFATTLRGVCMGIADIIPGVSGGTLALILGIYERFVGAVSAIGPGMLLAVFSREFWRRFAAGLKKPGAQGDDVVGRYAGHALFLSFLLVGIAFAFAVGAKVIPRLLDLYPAPMKGFFFGLVLASIRIPFRMMKRRGAVHVVTVIIAAIATWLFVGLPLDSSERARGDVVVALSAPAAEGTVLSREGLVLMTALHGGENEKHEVVFGPTHDIPVPTGATEVTVPVVARMAGTVANVQGGAIQVIHRGPAGATVSQAQPMQGGVDPSLIWIFIAGCIAISAMVLPGISGSFVLLMFGLYHYMTFTLRSLLYDRDPAAVTVVLVFVSAPGRGHRRLLARAELALAPSARPDDGGAHRADVRVATQDMALRRDRRRRHRAQRAADRPRGHDGRHPGDLRRRSAAGADPRPRRGAARAARGRDRESLTGPRVAYREPPAGARARPRGHRGSVQVEPASQILANLEEGHALRRHGHALAGLRVATGVGAVLTHSEVAEASHLDAIAAA
jgi:uncharacterized membrane protein